MISEEKIITQCDRCSDDYKNNVNCPRNLDCGNIVLLACRIQSAEYDRERNEKYGQCSKD